MFHRRERGPGFVRLIEASLTDWRPSQSLDLITCVHGLHYIGDKLGLIARAASWLTEDGLLLSNLDLANLKVNDAAGTNRGLAIALRRSGLSYDGKRKLLTCRGHRLFRLPYHYLGADDEAGPNYTGQPAVNSHYERSTAGNARTRR
jgi:hypothetical protein